MNILIQFFLKNYFIFYNNLSFARRKHLELKWLVLDKVALLLEKAMAPYSSTLAWRIPWTEEPGGLQSMGSLGVRYD